MSSKANNLITSGEPKLSEEIKVKKPRVKKEYNLLPYQDANKIEICIDECARGCGFGSTFIGIVILSPDFAEKATEEARSLQQQMAELLRQKGFIK